ncbi:carboxypeptidase-like regulatory domain-containing protein [Paraflavisolibacter sp. H34]|uniref:carboxypeptidase-like regulatory domain-containing protein n=1 Tax=Huijunlia imazamoxiresistens TaxID=3127457 RepID=UPI003019A48C
MRTIVLCLFLLLSFSLLAQRPLSASRRGSLYQYAYKISPAEALRLYRTGMQKAGERYLHTLVDSSLADSARLPPLPAGNYLLVRAVDNRLHYRLHTAGGLQWRLVNNRHDLAVALYDRQGREVADARVYFGHRRVPFDAPTQTFRLRRSQPSGTVRVYRQGVLYVFPVAEQKNRYTPSRGLGYRLTHSFPLKYAANAVRKWRKKAPYRSRPAFFYATAHEKSFRGFMVFSKPEYRPGDTVALKAFVGNKKGKGLHQKLLLRLSGRGLSTDTVLATLAPYRAGGYSFRFVLSDSLDLDLDEEYLLTLEEARSHKYDRGRNEDADDEEAYARKRKVVMRGKFRLEDYALKATTFSVRLDKKEHSRHEPAALYATATDENGLALLDSRIRVLVLPSGAHDFGAPRLFLPDTLWDHTEPLEAVGETRIALPDSIFPAASFSYEVRCTLLTSDNEDRTDRAQGAFSHLPRRLAFELRQDSLLVTAIARGRVQPAAAMVYALAQEGDTLEAQPLQLPARLAVHPFAARYFVRADSVSAAYGLPSPGSLVSARTFRTRDSVFLQLVNPARLPVWYTIFAGRKALLRGQGDTLLYVRQARRQATYSLSLQYLFAGRVHSQELAIPFRDKLLTVGVKAPEAVFPGQAADIEISVTDARGKAVADADVTAYAFTAKFTGAGRPALPYLGKQPPLRPQYAPFLVSEQGALQATGALSWQRWSRELGLDTVEYYRFLHPDHRYTSHEPAPDSLTQLAPFVVRNGDLLPIHLLYIDEKPIFFSGAEHQQRYSFAVRPGFHTLKLRTPGLLLTLDSVWVEKGQKTFLSVNAASGDPRLRLQPMPGVLTPEEQLLWSRYLLLVETVYGRNLAWVQQDDRLFPLLPIGRQRAAYTPPVPVGPLDNRSAALKVQHRFEQWFDVEGGYTYRITQGLVKQKQWKDPFPFRTWLSQAAPAPDFRDFVLTQAEVDSLWQDHLDHRNATEDLFYNPYLKPAGAGRLRVEVGRDTAGRQVMVTQLFLFRYDEPDFVRAYRGGARDLGYVQPGSYRLFLLLRGGHYVILDSLRVRPGGLNYFETGTLRPRLRDSVSARIAAITDRRKEAGYEASDLGVIKESFNDGFLDRSTFKRLVSGRVRGGSDQPLGGVTVSVKGTRVLAATATDPAGFFRLNVPDKAVLVFATVGYTSVEVPVTAANDYSIRLLPAKMRLEEVVVVGNGTQKKADRTASVSQVLEGRLAGVSIAPGNGAHFFIRGAASAETPPPLVIVDGLP